MEIFIYILVFLKIQNYMKYTILSTLFILMLSPLLWAQKSSVSTPKSYVIKPKIEPPILELVAGSLKFKDANANNAIDASETCSIEFALKNTGFGEAMNLLAKVEVQGTISGIQIQRQISLAKVIVNGTTQYRIPITSDMNTVNGKISMTIKIQEPNGFDPRPIALEIETRAFLSPLIKVTDYTLSGEGNLEAMKPFSLQLMLQNMGQGKGENIEISLQLPENVMSIGAETNAMFTTMQPGEFKKLEYQLIINARYTSTTVPVKLTIREKHGKYAESWSQSFMLNQQMKAAHELKPQALASQAQSFETASFKSDVDRNIPVNPIRHPNRYAVVIGNEDYASRNGSLNKAINVDYAQNDAEAFAEYLRLAFGIPAENIKKIYNATSGEMSGAINWIENLARAYGEQVELYFYYSGHGLPTEADRTPYLIPVDVSGDRPELGIALNTVYEKLTKHPARKITVVLDACFSGGARNEELIARKGIRVQPKSGAVKGNMVVLTSSSGTQSSGVYADKMHGYLTYFLLKEIQSRGIESTYGVLFEEAARKVDLETAIKGIIQQPQILPASEIGDAWKNWSVK